MNYSIYGNTLTSKLQELKTVQDAPKIVRQNIV